MQTPFVSKHGSADAPPRFPAPLAATQRRATTLGMAPLRGRTNSEPLLAACASWQRAFEFRNQPAKAAHMAAVQQGLGDAERSLLDEALGKKPIATGLPKLQTPQGPLHLAPSGSGGRQTWKSQRARYAHLPPITVTLWRNGSGDETREKLRVEVRVDEVARAGDLLRDLAAGGPAEGVLEQLRLRPGGLTPRSTPRGVIQSVTGLRKKGKPMHVRARLEEGGEYEVATFISELLLRGPGQQQSYVHDRHRRKTSR